MVLQNGTAAPGVGARHGGKTEKLGGVFQPQKYTTVACSTMPSAERPGLVSRVVARGNRLFLVGYFPGGAL